MAVPEPAEVPLLVLAARLLALLELQLPAKACAVFASRATSLLLLVDAFLPLPEIPEESCARGTSAGRDGAATGGPCNLCRSSPFLSVPSGCGGATCGSETTVLPL